MAKKQLTVSPSVEQLERQIYVVRGQRVMLDFDLSELYAVATKVLNQAMKRNLDRFPKDFAFQLTAQELTDLRSQIVTANPAHGKRRFRPWAFTEQGVAMLSSILRSSTAIKVNIEIMRAFVRVRRLLATPGELVAQLTKLAETVQLHDDQIKIITEALRQMMARPPDPPKSRIGFQSPVTTPNLETSKSHEDE
jgi:hypothetical protein